MSVPRFSSFLRVLIYQMSSTYKTEHHIKAVLFLKVGLNTHNILVEPICKFFVIFVYFFCKFKQRITTLTYLKTTDATGDKLELQTINLPWSDIQISSWLFHLANYNRKCKNKIKKSTVVVWCSISTPKLIYTDNQGPLI